MKIGGFATLLQVFDMSTSLAFYRDVLGFQVVSEVPADGRCDWVLLRLHETELMLNTAYEAEERPAVPDASRVAAHADTALFFDCEDVDVAYATLRDRVPDVKPPIVRAYGMKQLYLKDPDGYEICLQHPVNQGSG
jgi:glyoxylase I family protein